MSWYIHSAYIALCGVTVYLCSLYEAKELVLQCCPEGSTITIFTTGSSGQIWVVFSPFLQRIWLFMDFVCLSRILVKYTQPVSKLCSLDRSFVCSCVFLFVYWLARLELRRSLWVFDCSFVCLCVCLLFLKLEHRSSLCPFSVSLPLIPPAPHDVTREVLLLKLFPSWNWREGASRAQHIYADRNTEIGYDLFPCKFRTLRAGCLSAAFTFSCKTYSL